MTTLRPSLNKFAVVALLASASAIAQTKYCPKTFEVLERGRKDNYSFEKRELTKLFCNQNFEGEHFKIVLSTGEEPISFNHEDKELVKRAANVYHHLTIARDFWIKEINSELVKNLPQITIRLNITNAFSNTRHFRHEEQEQNFNNAWTIPEGQTPRFVKEQKRWYKEIWFSPMKKIESRKEVKSEGNNPIHNSLILVRDPLLQRNQNNIIYSGVNLLRTPNVTSTTLLDIAWKNLGPLAAVYSLLAVTKYMDKWFVDKYYFIDTAMVPEIIYHEFAHVALSDTMKPIHSVPVIEGMADYFAARIANRRKMYEKLEDISTNRSKDVENRSFYSPYLEGSWNATSDYTLSLLWRGRLDFEELNAKRVKKGHVPLANYDQLVHEAHFLLNENSDISHDLTKSLIDTCQSICDNSRVGINALNTVFEKKGLN